MRFEKVRDGPDPDKEPTVCSVSPGCFFTAYLFLISRIGAVMVPPLILLLNLTVTDTQ